MTNELGTQAVQMMTFGVGADMRDAQLREKSSDCSDQLGGARRMFQALLQVKRRGRGNEKTQKSPAALCMSFA